jgi:hypothetical protein
VPPPPRPALSAWCGGKFLDPWNHLKTTPPAQSDRIELTWGCVNATIIEK